MNTVRSSLSCIINPLALILQSQGSLKGFLIQNPLHQDTHDHETLTRYFVIVGLYRLEDLSLWDLTLRTVMVVSAQRDLQYNYLLL